MKKIFVKSLLFSLAIVLFYSCKKEGDLTVLQQGELPALTVSSSAVVFDKSKYWVMVFKDKDHIETRQVEIYRELGGITYLTGGIEVGERVFVKNQLLIYDAIND